MASLFGILPDVEVREKRDEELSCTARCRKKTLKYLQSRPTLVILCTLVIIECMCVLTELMVDLQAIRLRFENEETELNKFIDFLREAYPSQFNTSEDVSLDDVLQDLQRAQIVWGAKNSTYGKCTCAVCPTPTNNVPRNLISPYQSDSSVLQSRTTVPVHSNKNDTRPNALDKTMQVESKRTSKTPKKAMVKLHVLNEDNSSTVAPLANSKDSSDCCDYNQQHQHQEKIFVIEIHNKGEDFYLVGTLYPDNGTNTKHMDVNSEYYKLHLVSKGLHYGSIGILFLMVCEIAMRFQMLLVFVSYNFLLLMTSPYGSLTQDDIIYKNMTTEMDFQLLDILTVVKQICMGKDFCKQKLEVFDAFIVISSFCLDFLFLGNPGVFGAGKDAATILVFFLPWRVIRIVNSFLMTMNHKHHIEMMTIQRSKKKAEQKIVKIQSLLNEIRRDVQLLVALAKSKGANEEEISACIYGQGRAGSTMSAISSFASLMLISTLGKDRGDADDIYGNMISDALKEDEEEVNESKGKRRSEKKHNRPSIFRQLSSLQEESLANGHVTATKTPSSLSNGHTSAELYSICNGHFSGDKDSPENLDLEPNHNGISSIGSTSRTSPCCESRVVVEMTSQTTYL